MFKWQKVAFISLLAAIFIGAFYFFDTTPEDDIAYQELMLLADRSGRDLEAGYMTQQKRIGTVKDLFFVRNGERLHNRLMSEQSEVQIDYRDKRTSVLENLRQAHCLIQEKLLHDPTPMQIIASVEADKASYHYQTGQLVANDVAIKRYLIPTHQLDQFSGDSTLLSKGHADSIVCSLAGREVNLKAKKFKGSLLNPEKMDISSAEAFYDGAEISLLGNARVQHRLGNVSSNQIRIIPPNLQMDQTVLIELKGGGRLTCDRAKVDYIALKGVFYGEYPNGKVLYTDSTVTAQKRKTALPGVSIESHRMQMDLKENQESSKYFISKIAADGDVIVNDSNGFSAASDAALYQGNSPSSSGLNGTIDMRMRTQENFCRVSHRNGDEILATDILIDMAEGTLTFNNAKGTLISRSQSHRDAIDFSAKRLLWEEASQLLTLSQDVVIDQQGMGKLSTDNDMLVYEHTVDTKKEIKKIVSTKNTTLSYLDDLGSHTLVCYGPLQVDHELMQIVMVSPVDGEGRVVQGKQISFTDRFGDIFADKVTVDYERVNQKLNLKLILLEGNVKIFNRINKEDSDDEVSRQYALADEVSFLPINNEMYLKASSGRRVLFFDDVNQLQISAPALKIHRDKVTNQNAVQGMGDVRFNFIEHEFDQLKQIFNLRR